MGHSERGTVKAHKLERVKNSNKKRKGTTPEKTTDIKQKKTASVKHSDEMERSNGGICSPVRNLAKKVSEELNQELNTTKETEKESSGTDNNNKEDEEMETGEKLTDGVSPRVKTRSSFAKKPFVLEKLVTPRKVSIKDKQVKKVCDSGSQTDLEFTELSIQIGQEIKNKNSIVNQQDKPNKPVTNEDNGLNSATHLSNVRITDGDSILQMRIKRVQKKSLAKVHQNQRPMKSLNLNPTLKGTDEIVEVNTEEGTRIERNTKRERGEAEVDHYQGEGK